MAIDNAEKRRSVAGIAAHPLGPAVTPNVAKDAEWRLQAAWSYSGIAAAAPAVATGRSTTGLYIGFGIRI